jgi:hypothetical protein
MARSTLVIAAMITAACSAGPTKEPASTDGDVAAPSSPAAATDAAPAEPTAKPDTTTKIPPKPEAEPKVPPEPKAKADNDAEPQVIRFAWKPKRGPAEAYEMTDPADQHRLVLTPGVEQGGSYPVVVAFHGQPPRGMAPSEYRFPDDTQKQVVGLVRKGRIQAVILVIPVFRFIGGNWPWFDLKEFRKMMEEKLAELELTPTDWYAFGHSGAAGCKGDGLNRAHRMKPKAVGYFDTCIGQGWADEIGRLRKRGVRVLNVHSVETAGFVPKQTPEYQSTFDFGRAYKPAGMKPVECPKNHPGVRLRDQKYRCAASDDGLLKAFVIDSGQGKQAHRNVLVPAIRFFLVDFARLGRKG